MRWRCQCCCQVINFPIESSKNVRLELYLGSVEHRSWALITDHFAMFSLFNPLKGCSARPTSWLKDHSYTSEMFSTPIHRLPPHGPCPRPLSENDYYQFYLTELWTAACERLAANPGFTASTNGSSHNLHRKSDVHTAQFFHVSVTARPRGQPLKGALQSFHRLRRRHVFHGRVAALRKIPTYYMVSAPLPILMVCSTHCLYVQLQVWLVY